MLINKLPIFVFRIFLIAIVALPINSLHAQTTTAVQTQSAREKALRLLLETPLVDGHIDLPNKIQEYYGNRLDRIDLASDLGKIAQDMPFQTDIPRLRRGHAGGALRGEALRVPVNAKQIAFPAIPSTLTSSERGFTVVGSRDGI